MKTEVSAGGLSSVKGKKKWMVLVARDMNDEWTFPKEKFKRMKIWNRQLCVR